jgi:hypothetical protein
MATIKSAYEIAMENTKSIEGDKELVEVNRLKDEGKKLVSKVFDDPAFNVKEALKVWDKKQLESVKDGLVQSLLANLVLPMDEVAQMRNRRIGEAFTSVTADTKKLAMMFSQLEQFFKEYMDERKRLIEAIDRQYAPKLQKKEEEVSKQLGRPVKINPASDPEFQGLVRQYLGQLDVKYDGVLTNAKEEIKALTLKT